MKKFLAILLVALMLLGAVACSKPAAPAADAPKADEPAKVTEAPKADEPAKSDEPAAEAAPVYTQGVFKCEADATHFVLIKLKEDGTFYARGLMGQTGYFGKYEVVDMAVEYYNAGADGVLKQEDQPFDVRKSEKAVKFMHEDGSPYEVRFEPETVKIDDVPTPVTPLNDGVGKEYVAYAEDMLHHVKFDDYSRSLTHKPNEKFTEADEIRNLLYKFMVAEVPEAQAAEGWKQQELTLELYHNGYVDMATADEMADEAYQKIEGNVFTLHDGATVTVDPDAYTAVYEKDGVTINFVKYNENGSDAPVVAVKAQYEGEAFSGAVKLIARMYEDGTITISADKGGTESVIASGTWEGAGLPTITLDKGTAVVKATSATDVKLVYTTDLGDGKETDYELAMVAVPAAEPVVKAHYEGEAFGGMIKLFAEMYEDGSIKIWANKGGEDIELASGTWEGAGLPTITLDKGKAEVKATSAEDVKLIFTADIGTGSESDYEMAKTN